MSRREHRDDGSPAQGVVISLLLMLMLSVALGAAVALLWVVLA